MFLGAIVMMKNRRASKYTHTPPLFMCKPTIYIVYIVNISKGAPWIKQMRYSIWEEGWTNMRNVSSY